MNYWPGYVDALTNVVLNLLFLIAMFGIALSVLNSEQRSQTKATTAPPPAQDSGGALPGRVAGLVPAMGDRLLAPAPAGSATIVRLRVTDGLPGAAGRVVETSAVRAVANNAGAAGTIGRSGPGGRWAEASPTSVRQSVPMERGAGDTNSAGEGISALARQQANGPGSMGGGYPPAGAVRNPLDFTVVDAYQRPFMPGVRVTRQVNAAGATLLTVALPLGAEPVAALRQSSFRSTLRDGLGSGAGQGKVRLWTATRLIDPTQRRTAYLSLIEARNQLIAIGFSPAAIESRLIEGSAASRDEKRIFILALPANAN